MSKANEIQHGGDHYKGRDYQHWDWVCDISLPYLLACATKYVSRWRKKGGRLDLEKAMHYVQKAEEKGVQSRPSWRDGQTRAFIAQHGEKDAFALWRIVSCDYDAARMAIRDLLDEAPD